jgi:hypothetical protein
MVVVMVMVMVVGEMYSTHKSYPHYGLRTTDYGLLTTHYSLLTTIF